MCATVIGAEAEAEAEAVAEAVGVAFVLLVLALFLLLLLLLLLLEVLLVVVTVGLETEAAAVAVVVVNKNKKQRSKPRNDNSCSMQNDLALNHSEDSDAQWNAVKTKARVFTCRSGGDCFAIVGNKQLLDRLVLRVLCCNVAMLKMERRIKKTC